MERNREAHCGGNGVLLEEQDLLEGLLGQAAAQGSFRREGRININSMGHQQPVIRAAGLQGDVFRHTLLGPVGRRAEHDLLAVLKDTLSNYMLNRPEPCINVNQGIGGVARELQ